MAFTKTFEPAYHFRLLYLPGVLYPIMGALRYCAGESWQVGTCCTVMTAADTM